MILSCVIDLYPGRSQERHAGPWRGCQDGISQTEGDARVWYQLLHAAQRGDGHHSDSAHHPSRHIPFPPKEDTSTMLW